MDKILLPVMIFAVLLIILAAVWIKRQTKTNKQLKNLETWTKITNVVGGFVTAVSLIWAAYTYYDSARSQKLVAASGIYTDHMKLSMSDEMKDFIGASDIAQKPPPVSTDLLEKKVKYERYKWYVGHALVSFESILEVSNDDEWKGTFKCFIYSHRIYLSSDQFHANRYDQKLETLINETLQNPPSECKTP